MSRQKTKAKFVIGVKPVETALNEGLSIEKIFIQRGSNKEFVNLHKEELSERNIPLLSVPKEKMQRLTSGNHQGLLAIISPIAFQNLEDLVPFWIEQGKAPFVLALDGITDVRNLGAIARSALGLGVDALLLPKLNSAALNEVAIKTSAGALLKIPVCRSPNFLGSFQFLQLNGFSLLGLDGRAQKNIQETRFDKPLCLVVGSEENGISPKNRKALQLVKIPMSKDIESFNASVATAICLYEIERQLQHS